MFAAVFFAALVHAPLPAHAQYAECTAVGKTADERIKTCTIAIAAETGTRAARAYNFRGIAWHDKYELDRAMADYDQAVRLDPSSANAVNNRGIAWQAKGNLDRAIADHTRAIALDPKDDAVGAYRFRSIALRLKGETDRAIADASEAIRLYPDYNAAYVDRGLAYEDKRDLQRARADYNQALVCRRNIRAARRPTATRANGWPRSIARPRCRRAKARRPRHQPACRAGDRQQRLCGEQQTAQSRSTTRPTWRRLCANSASTWSRARISTGRGMDNAIREFGRKLERAELALFFYAGHGLQVGGKNYLVPVDAKLERPGDLALDAVDIGVVLAQMEAEKRVNLIFLDACRDNPLARSLSGASGTRSASVGNGLAPVQGAIGTLISYATQPDNVALDGQGRNSPFTAALVRHIASPGLDIGAVMRRVRAEVIAATREKPGALGSFVADWRRRAGALRRAPVAWTKQRHK